MPTAIHVDTDKVEQCIRESPEWRQLCEKLAVDGASYAQSVAPVKTGRYRASISGGVVPSTAPDSVIGAPSVEVGASATYALEVEFQHPARHHTLLNTLDHLMLEI